MVQVAGQASRRSEREAHALSRWWPTIRAMNAIDMTVSLRPSGGLPRERCCLYCRWVEVAASTRHAGQRSLQCTNPKYLRGMAAETRSCCLFEREPGADDDLDVSTLVDRLSC